MKASTRGRRSRHPSALSFVLIWLFFLPFPTQAQAPAQSDGGLGVGSDATGRIVGRVLSAENAEPLQSVQVVVVGRDVGGLTSMDGRYVLREVPSGVYDLQVQLIGYGTKTVTGVRVTTGSTTTLDLQLSPQAVDVAGITVTAAAERGSTTSLMTERKLSAVVSDAIGRDQISRSADGDAAAALKRVPGLSVVDGKFAYVRGLGERYSSTSLNGAPLASPVPDKKVMPLDLFPASLLESIVTAKSYSPEQPGDFAGGLVKLRTRAFPPNRIFEVSLGGTWNSAASFRTGLGYGGGGTDFLGFDDGARGLPAAIPADQRVTRGAFDDGQLEAMGEAFGGDWGPVVRNVPMNSSFGLTWGDDFDLGTEQRLGFIASATYSNGYDVRSNQIERVFSQDAVDEPEVDYLGDFTTHSVQWGGLMNLTWQPSATHQIGFSGVYTHLADDLARRLTGFNLDSNTDQLNTRLQYIATTTQNYQLEGAHGLGFLGGAALDWRGAFTRAARYEPNTRDVLYRKIGDVFVFDDFIQSGSVFHQDQDDDGWNGGSTLTLPFDLDDRAASVAVGASTDRKDRDTYSRRFRFRPMRGGDLGNDDLALGPNDLFTPERIGPRGFELQEATFNTDNYGAREVIDGAFLKLDLPLVEGVRVSGGVRVERSSQTVTPRQILGAGDADLPGADLASTDWLPALNLTVSVTEDMNLRASGSQTLARPQLRELAPFSFADYAGGYLVSGNPLLEQATIRSWDLRWEWFPRTNAVVAVSGFYKTFDDPIEVLVLPSTELIKSWVNAEGATNVGAEVEVRTDLGFLGDRLRNVELNANLTVVESEVATGGTSLVYIAGQGATELQVGARDRALQGQSPYVVNLGLGWFDPLSGASASVLFNRFGRRIDTVGREQSPDIYEEARSQFDLVLERPVGDWKVKVAASRLLGSDVEFTQLGEVIRAYDLGRSVSFGLTWSPTRGGR